MCRCGYDGGRCVGIVEGCVCGWGMVEGGVCGVVEEGVCGCGYSGGRWVWV